MGARSSRGSCSGAAVGAVPVEGAGEDVEDPQRAALVAHQLEAAEAALIASETIPGVAFRTVGAVR